MFEIRIDEPGRALLAIHPTAAEALADTDRIGDETVAQLETNGEGYRRFW